MNGASCGCAACVGQSERVPAFMPGARPASRRQRVEGVMRESVAVPYKPPKDAQPLTIEGMKRGSKCRPFLKIEKDEEKFAACNALAEELGAIDDPKKAFQIIEDAIGDEVNEVFGVMMLDLHLRFKGLAEMGRGEPTSVMAPIKPTLQMALADGAHAIIIFHCHPSGIEAEPSDADIETTDAFADACEVIDLPLLDHVIIGGDVRKRSYYSFAENKAL